MNIPQVYSNATRVKAPVSKEDDADTRLALEEQEQANLVAKREWLALPATKRFLDDLKERKVSLLDDCMNLNNIAFTEPERARVCLKLKELATINDTIEYAENTSTRSK